MEISITDVNYCIYSYFKLSARIFQIIDFYGFDFPLKYNSEIGTEPSVGESDSL